MPASKELVKAFNEEHPDISVDIQLTPFTSYWTKLQTSMTGGAAPDVFWMNGPNIELYASNGVILPLQERVDSDKDIDLSKHPKPLVDLYKYEGRQFGIPKDFDTVSCFYNKKLLDSIGSPYPDENWTWDDVRRVSKEIHDPKRRIYGIGSDFDVQRNLYTVIYQAGGSVVEDGKCGLGEPEAIAGMHFWTDQINSGVLQNAMAMADTGGIQQFLSGHLALYYALPNNAGQFYASKGLREIVDVAPLPRGRKRATVIHGLANVINARTPWPDAAWEFVKFMAGKKAGEIIGASGSAVPSFSGTQGKYLASMPEFNMQTYIDQQDVAVAYPTSIQTRQWEALINQNLIKSWAGPGAPSVDSQAKTVAKQTKKILAREKAL